MKPASLHFAAQVGMADPASISPFRARYAGGVDLERLTRSYRGAPGKPDKLHWERHHPIIDTQALPHGNVAKLIAEGILRVPHDATTIFIDEYATICKCSEGYAHWGTIHIGNKLVSAGRARSFVSGQLMDMGVLNHDELGLKSMVRDLCHGESYMIAEGGISMIVPKGKGHVFCAEPSEIVPLRRNHWDELAERQGIRPTDLGIPLENLPVSEGLVATQITTTARPRLAMSSASLAARAENARKATPYNGAAARAHAASFGCKKR